MKSTLRRVLGIGFFAVYCLAVTWPVVMWFAEPMPLIGGLPMPLAWSILWILLGFIVLIFLEWSRERSQ